MKLSALITATLLVAGCIAPARRESPVHENTQRIPADSAGDRRPLSSGRAKRPTSPLPTQPAALPVAQWTGERFVLLEILPAFRANGHHLYASINLDTETSPDTDIAHSSNRLRHDLFAGRHALVEAVAPLDNGEYLLTFRLDTLNLFAYAATRGETVEGIARSLDLDAARRQWVGKTIYSKRRIIDRYDAKTGAFANTKVSVRAPLRVHAVRWGTTPLPPKPLWLMVVTDAGDSGFIPINQSWTNVSKQARADHAPWESEVFARDPEALYDWDPYVWESIDKHSIFIGMTLDQVRMSWQAPREKLVAAGGDSGAVRLQYNNTTLLFRNDTLIAQH
jgi:hypothetical protein